MEKCRPGWQAVSEEQTVLGRGLHRLLKTETSRSPTALLLSGPRGLGKTVLLRWLREEAEKGGADVTHTNASELSTRAELAYVLAPGVVDTARKDGFNFSIAGAGISHTPGAPVTEPHWPMLLKHTLSKRKTPLLVTIDEGHTLPGEVVFILANLVQELLWECCPVWFVLAGYARDAGAFEHGRRGGPHQRGCTHCKLLWPGDQDGVGFIVSGRHPGKRWKPPWWSEIGTVEPESLAQVLEDAQCYPYFLQLWGAALWDAGT